MQFEILTDKGTSVNLIRYFMLNNKQFLIYSDASEGSDAQGHLTIHISEIKVSDYIVADTVSDEDWENIKNIIKGIVNANKNNQPLPIEDLDYNTIDGVNIVGGKALKLMANYVDLLKLNQPKFEKKVVENIIKPAEETVINADGINNLNFNVNPAAHSFENETSTLNNANVVMPTEIPSFNESSENVSNTIDYKKLYEEQLELNRNLQNEISNYKNIIETVKNIINN